MKGKIISLTVVILMIFGSIGATGLNNLTNKENIELYNQFKQDDKIIEDIESDCNNCEYEGYYFGLLGDPFVLFEPEKLVELSGDPPESWDWRNATYNGTTGNWVTSVKDQGECGSCASFASVACFESVYKISKSDPNIDVDFSEQFMVSCGKEWIGNKNCFTRMQGCQGATIFAVLEFIKKHGAINETCFSYTSGINGVVPPCSDKCENWKEQRIRAKDYKLVMGEIIEEDDDTVDYDPTNYKNALVKYGPLATPMFVYEDFIDYKGGIYELNRSKPWKRLAYHMVLIVGYQDDPSIDSGGYWICKNSWGTDWGENGYFRVKYDDFTIWFHKEYNDRVQNIKNLRDLIEFFIWYYLLTKNSPIVGIGYIFSAFFTGVTMKKLEISTPIEKHSKDISFPVFHGWQPFINFLQNHLNLFPILQKILLLQRY